MYEIWRSKKENLNVMYRLTFADAGVTGPIFKCQPATYCCWETSCCILLSFYSVCSLSPGIFYNVSLSLMGGHYLLLKHSNKINKSQVVAQHRYKMYAATGQAWMQPWGFKHFLNNQRWNICIRDGNVITSATGKNKLQNQSWRRQTCATVGDGASLFVCLAKQTLFTTALEPH